jgi:hypothetical protein
MSTDATIAPGFGLGLAASGKRTISSGEQYDKYFALDKVDGEETELADGDVFLTLRLMAKMVRNTLQQTKKITEHEFEGYSRSETCRRIWNFLYKHVQYKKDNPLREQLRQPARTWYDRRTGVDCDCYSIFISSILSNLKIPHAFCMAAYDGDWQHVYVIVPKSGHTIGSDRSSYLVIDPVVNQFNYETPATKKHNHSMGKITQLSGLEAACPTRPAIDRLRRYVTKEEVIENGFVPTDSFLREHNIPFQFEVDPDTDGGVLLINTTAGPRKLPTIITPAQAQSLVAGSATAAAPGPAIQHKPSTVTASATDLGKISWLPLIIVAGLGAATLFGKKKAATASLSGPPKSTLPTLHI